VNTNLLRLARLSLGVAGLLLTGCSQTEHSADAPASAGGAATAASVQPESEALKLCEEMHAAIQRSRGGATRTDQSAERRVAECMVGVARFTELERTIRMRIDASETALKKELNKFIFHFHPPVDKLMPPQEQRAVAAATPVDDDVRGSSTSDKPAAQPTPPPRRTTPIGELPHHFQDTHRDFVLQILDKYRPLLAERLRNGTLNDAVQIALRFCGHTEVDRITGESRMWPPEDGRYDRTCDVNFENMFKRTDLQAEDPLKYCADYIARCTYEVADPKQRLQEMLKEFTIETSRGARAEEQAAVVQGAAENRSVNAEFESLWKEVFGESASEQASHPLQLAYPLVKKHLPEEAARYAEFARMIVSHHNETMQRQATELVWEVFRMQKILHEHDADRNGVQDYWTADVAGLFRLKVDDRPLYRELRRHTETERYWYEIAVLDAAPLNPGDATYAPAEAIDDPLSYRFQAVRRDAQGVSYAQDTDRSGRAWRNGKQFAACAFPKRYPGDGRQTYLINETGVIWFKDTAGKPVEQFPKDLEADGWARAAKQPIEQYREEK